MNVLGVFAHPDDEVLGCGGTLAKHAEAGDDVLVVCLAVRKLDRELAAACEALGAKQAWFDLPDQAFDTVGFSEIAGLIEGHALYETADVVYTHHPGDLNLDHALTARAVLTAFRPKPGEKPRTILACEVLSSTEWTFPQVFQPNWFEALEWRHVATAKRALLCYPSECEPYPHPRSQGGLQSKLSVRGQQCGVAYAEAFQLLRRGPC